MQSSRVGVRTTACTSSLPGSTYCSSGRPKAAVLPVPVCAWPITSWPPSSSGIAWSWIGVGSSKPSSSSACWIWGERPRPLKAVIGHALPISTTPECGECRMRVSPRRVQEELAAAAPGNQVFVGAGGLRKRVDAADRDLELAGRNRAEQLADHRRDQLLTHEQVDEPEADHRLRAAQKSCGGDVALFARGDPEDDHPAQRGEDAE